MNKKISKNQEFKHFSEIASEWWLPKGKFKILHDILPLRLEYIVKNISDKNVKNIDILDLGCGGGLVCEALSKLGAHVTGIDFVKKNIEIAKIHAKQSKLKIDYRFDDIDTINLKNKFDVILILEVIEHLDNYENLIKKIKHNLKPGGKMIFSTINKTHLANIFGIFVAENILNWVPKKTHDYNKLIKPNDLKNTLTKNNLAVTSLEGMNYNPVSREWFLSKKFFPINYFCSAKLI